jgi:hypothetical protein
MTPRARIWPTSVSVIWVWYICLLVVGGNHRSRDRFWTIYITQIADRKHSGSCSSSVWSIRLPLVFFSTAGCFSSAEAWGSHLDRLSSLKKLSYVIFLLSLICADKQASRIVVTFNVFFFFSILGITNQKRPIGHQSIGSEANCSYFFRQILPRKRPKILTYPNSYTYTLWVRYKLPQSAGKLGFFFPYSCSGRHYSLPFFFHGPMVHHVVPRLAFKCETIHKFLILSTQLLAN